MQVIETILELNRFLAPCRAADQSIGFVPTMGSLHDGHLSLAAAALAENDLAVMSVFVNPTQFTPGEDFDTYPRDLERDAALAADAGVDAIFAPAVETVYPAGFSTFVEVSGAETEGMCAGSRPGHFRGVTTVVTVLLNLVRPTRCYFGQKDAQQLAVVKKMARDLALPYEIIGCPIVREPDGFAMSSRNAYLTKEDRRAAPVLYRSLLAAKDEIQSGQRSRDKIISTVERLVAAEPRAVIEYVDVRASDDFSVPEQLAGEIIIAVAARFGAARLIDNMVVEVNEQ